MASPDPDIRRAVGRLGAATRLDGLDADGRRALTAGAIAAQHQRDLDAVDAEAAARGETLTNEERDYRASVKRRARMAALQLKSAQARKAKSDARKAAERDAELATLAQAEAGAL